MSDSALFLLIRLRRVGDVELTGLSNSLLQNGALVVGCRQEHKVVDHEISVDFDRKLPPAGIKVKRSRNGPSGDGDQGSSRLEADFGPLLGIIRILGRGQNLSYDWLIRRIRIAEDDTVKGGFVHVDVMVGLRLEFIVDGVSPPRVILEEILIVAKAGWTAGPGSPILSFILELVEGRKVMSLKGLSARFPRDARATQTFPTVLLTDSMHGPTHVATTFSASEKGGRAKLVISVRTFLAPLSDDVHFAGAIPSLPVTHFHSTQNPRSKTLAFLTSLGIVILKVPVEWFTLIADSSLNSWLALTELPSRCILASFERLQHARRVTVAFFTEWEIVVAIFALGAFDFIETGFAVTSARVITPNPDSSVSRTIAG